VNIDWVPFTRITCIRYVDLNSCKILLGLALISLQRDKAYLQSLWTKWKLALEFSMSKIDSSGLMNVTLTNDWGRLGQGGHNIAVRINNS